MLPSQMRGGRVRPKTEKTVRLAVSPERAAAAAETEKRSPKRAALLHLMADGQERTVRELAEAVKDPREALKKLADDGLIELTDRETMRVPAGSWQEVQDPGYRLTTSQQEALGEIVPCLHGDGGRFLIAAGRKVAEYSGLWQNSDGSWLFIAEGQVADYTGLTQYDGAWFYVIDGQLATDFTGDVEYDGAMFHVDHGMLVG